MIDELTKEDQNEQADDDAVNAEGGEVVLLNVADQEFDGDDGYQERSHNADTEDHPLGGGVSQAVAQELQNAPAEHDGNGQEKGEFSCHRARGTQ